MEINLASGDKSVREGSLIRTSQCVMMLLEMQN